MTSNMGSHIIQEKFEKMDMKNRDLVTEATKVEVIGLLRQTIRPEFLNRIDEIIMFTPLNLAEIHQIVKLQLNGLINMLKAQDIHIEYTEDLVEALANKGFDPQFGARPVKRVIQKDILNQLSKEILSARVTSDSHILLDAFDDKIVFRNK